jgi:hypothetical protein
MSLKLLIPSLLISICLAGCTTTKLDSQPSVAPKVVEIPVIQEWPEPPPNDRPVLPYLQLTPDQRKDVAAMNQALAASVEILVKYSQRLELTVDAYRHKK